jgi:hypothetical protein
MAKRTRKAAEPLPAQTTPPSWEGEVAFPTTGAYAYRPGHLLVLDAVTPEGRLVERIEDILTGSLFHDDAAVVDDVLGYSLIRVSEDADIPLMVEELRGDGFDAQPVHILFADQDGAGLYAEAFEGNPLSGNPLSGNPLSGNPLSGNPLSGNPLSGNPLSGNPYLEGLLYGNLFERLLALGYPLPTPTLAGPRGRAYARTGRGRNTARPTPSPWPGKDPLTSTEAAQVTILDVPLPTGPLPSVLSKCQPPKGFFGLPDGDDDGFLDRVAGHGLLVAGIVAQAYPDCPMEVVPLMDNLGYVDETAVAKALDQLAGTTDIVNMSFSGYALRHMGCLARAVRRFQLTPGPASHGETASRRHGGVVVCSAGNDAAWQAPYPAALPGVVSVAALGPYGPAPFTNRGRWVRACAAGVDVVTTFFTPESWGADPTGKYKEGKEPPGPEGDPDLFTGAAIVSGTSFAAPVVAGRLGQLVRYRKMLPKEAVRHLLDAPGLATLPWLGTIVTA